MSLESGIHYNIPMADYLKLPALSASLLKTIIDECPAAAWWSSWLNPQQPAKDDTSESDIGTIAHALLLEGNEDGLAVIDPNDYPAKTTGAIPQGWTNNAIRSARDNARLEGKIPILANDVAEIRAMVQAAKAFISKSDIGLSFDGGDSEVTMLWLDGDTLCKMRPDRISKNNKVVINYKTTSSSIAPDAWGRGAFLDHYVGAAWYRRGIQAICGVECEYVYLVQSVNAPYLCSLVGVDPHAFSLGAAKCEYALREWQACVAKNSWPAYPNKICYPILPGWVETQWAEKEAHNVFV